MTSIDFSADAPIGMLTVGFMENDPLPDLAPELTYRFSTPRGPWRRPVSLWARDRWRRLQTKPRRRFRILFCQSIQPPIGASRGLNRFSAWREIPPRRCECF